MRALIIIAITSIIAVGGLYLYLFSTDVSIPEGGRSERGDEVVEVISSYSNITAGTNVKSGTGIIRGIFVASASGSPQLKVYDSTVHRTGETILINAFTPVSATMYDFGSGIEFTSGVFVVVSGTVDATVFYR